MTDMKSREAVEALVETLAKAMAEEANPSGYWPGNEGRMYQSIGAGMCHCSPIDETVCNRFRRYARAAEAFLSPPATETGIPDGMVLVPVEALPVFERVIRLADTLASDVPITASARKHITDAYAALAALQPGEGK